MVGAGWTGQEMCWRHAPQDYAAIQFHDGDLADCNWDADFTWTVPTDFPIIFCRNAFIYFSPKSVKAVASTFAVMMPVPAYLFLGASESLLNVTDRFMLDDLERSFVYVKR